MLPKDSKARNNLGKVLSSANRAKDLVQQILAFGRSSQKERIQVTIHSTMQEAVKLLQGTTPSNIEINQGIDQACGPVLADSSAIYQMIMNLCSNAYHAMNEKGGTLGIFLTEEEITPGSVHDRSLSPGKYLKLSVTDTGHGMEKDVLEQIFDPFFTTKSMNKGIGMGLAVVQSIVSGHDGSIFVDSTHQKGTTVHVYLPLIDSVVADKVKPEAVPEMVTDKKVLLVDDDEQIVLLLEQMLDCLGFQVEAHTSSVNAANFFQARSDDFDFVITDFAMPLMDGIELAESIISIRPDIPIMMCTGFYNDETEKKAKAAGIREFIGKPVSLNSLNECIKRLIQ